MVNRIQATTFIIIKGPTASGKTTWCSTIKNFAAEKRLTVQHVKKKENEIEKFKASLTQKQNPPQIVLITVETGNDTDFSISVSREDDSPGGVGIGTGRFLHDLILNVKIPIFSYKS